VPYVLPIHNPTLPHGRSEGAEVTTGGRANETYLNCHLTNTDGGAEDPPLPPIVACSRAPRRLNGPILNGAPSVPDRATVPTQKVCDEILPQQSSAVSLQRRSDSLSVHSEEHKSSGRTTQAEYSRAAYSRLSNSGYFSQNSNAHENAHTYATPRIGYWQAFKKWGYDLIYDNDWKAIFSKLNDREFLALINACESDNSKLIFEEIKNILYDIEIIRHEFDIAQQRLNQVVSSINEEINSIAPTHEELKKTLDEQETELHVKLNRLNELKEQLPRSIQADFQISGAEIQVKCADALSEAVPPRFKRQLVLAVDESRKNLMRMAENVSVCRRAFSALGVCATISLIPFFIPLLANEKIYHSTNVGIMVTTCLQALGMVLLRPTTDWKAWKFFMKSRGLIANLNTAIFLPTTVLPFALEKIWHKKEAATAIHHWGFKYSGPAAVVLVTTLLTHEFKWLSKLKVKYQDWRYGKEDLSTLQLQVPVASRSAIEYDVDQLRNMHDWAESKYLKLQSLQSQFKSSGKEISDLLNTQLIQAMEPLGEIIRLINIALPIKQPEQLTEVVIDAEDKALGDFAARMGSHLKKYDSARLNDSKCNVSNGGCNSNATESVEPHSQYSIPLELQDRKDKTKPKVQLWLDNQNHEISLKVVDKDRVEKWIITGASGLLNAGAVACVWPNQIGAVGIGSDGTAVTILFASDTRKISTNTQYMLAKMKNYNGGSTIIPFVAVPNKIWGKKIIDGKSLTFIEHSKYGYYGSMVYFSVALSGCVGPTTTFVANILQTALCDGRRGFNKVRRLSCRNSEAPADASSLPLPVINPPARAAAIDS
jgi:hypothetical protein